MYKFRVGNEKSEILVSTTELEKLKKKSKWLEALIKYEGSDGETFLPKTCPTIFQKLLKLLLNNDEEIKGEEEEVLLLLHMSHMLDFKEVEERCCNLLLSNLRNSYLNVFNNTAILNLGNRLEEDAFFMVKFAINEILDEGIYLDWNVYTIMEILKCDHFSVSEVSLLRAVCRWSEENKVSYSTFEKLLCFIRFSMITQTEFENFVVTRGYDIMTLLVKQFYADSIKNPVLFNCTPRNFQPFFGVEF